MPLFITLMTAMLAPQYAAAYTYTVLDGTFTHENEATAMLVDGDIHTKWGLENYISGVTECYVIFKSDRAIVPKNYCIFIANDTQGRPERNWQSWNIYAANFNNDEEAVRNASAWVLVDKKENEVVPTEPFVPVDYNCSEDISDAYIYFMVEVTATVSASAVYQQMSEFSWGTSNEFFNSGPISYFVLDGSKNDTSNEGLPKLFDGSYTTKFGNGFTEGEPQFAVFKTTRPV